MKMFVVARLETGSVKYVINIWGVPCKHYSVVFFHSPQKRNGEAWQITKKQKK